MRADIMRDGEKKLAETGMAFTGVSSRPGDSPRLTREYLDSLMVEFRVIDAVEASTKATLFGLEFATPVMVAAVSGLDRIRPDGMVEVARGASAAGAVMWAGVGDEYGLKTVIDTGAKTVKIIKPYRDGDLILREIEEAERCGAVAVGMDVSFGFGMKSGFAPAPMSPKSLDELKNFIRSTSLPFILKGILSERDAGKALEAGAGGIVVSHQGGTVLDFAVPPVRILPRISGIVNRRTSVFVDCGITDGLDAFKAIALGADGVCVGKAVLAGLAAGGEEGVRTVLEDITAGLQRAMSLTGATDIATIDPSVIWS